MVPEVGGVATIVLADYGQNARDQAVQFAETNAIDTIFVGTRGLGAVKRFFLGSFSTHIVHHAHCNVFVAKQ